MPNPLRNAKKVEEFLNNLPTKPVYCPNVCTGCSEDGMKCPHSESHEAGEMCRRGICFITFQYLECNPKEGD